MHSSFTFKISQFKNLSLSLSRAPSMTVSYLCGSEKGHLQEQKQKRYWPMQRTKWQSISSVLLDTPLYSKSETIVFEKLSREQFNKHFFFFESVSFFSSHALLFDSSYSCTTMQSYTSVHIQPWKMIIIQTIRRNRNSSISLSHPFHFQILKSQTPPSALLRFLFPS